MKLNHLDLPVSDVEAAHEFFERFFGLRCTCQRRGEIAMLEDEAGFQLGVSNLRGLPPAAYPPDFHVGFVLERAGEVQEIYDSLKSGRDRHEV